MKRILAFLIAILLIAPMAFAAPLGKVEILFDAVTINATATSASRAIPGSSSGTYGVWYKATSSGSAPDIKIEAQMSHNDTTTNFVEPTGVADIVTNLTAETAQVTGVYLPPMEFMRILVTGNALNPSDTVVTLYLFSQE